MAAIQMAQTEAVFKMSIIGIFLVYSLLNTDFPTAILRNSTSPKIGSVFDGVKSMRG